MKLVDTLAEQEILEKIVESTKPTVPEGCRDFHYLLFTPFRYGAPRPHGSRFRRAGMTEGVFYGSETPETALAEIVFYRFLFFAESPSTPLPTNPAEYTVFETHLRSDAVLDLTRDPLSRDGNVWRDLSSYDRCQDLADAARACDAQIIRYESVRDPNHGANYAVLTYKAFAQKWPLRMQSWRLHLKAGGALVACESPKNGLTFSLSDFLADKRLSPLAQR